MKLNRRGFLQGFGLAGSGGLLGLLGVDLKPSRAYAETAVTQRAKVSTTICPYCGGGCGALVMAVDGKVVNVEGDPDHPINEGSLCSKGAALWQIANNDQRLTTVKYRAPGTSDWEEKSWDWAIEKIAANIKATRDKSFVAADDQGRTINRTEGIGCLGGAGLDNEECYAYSKWLRSLGITYVEHQARL
jgi:formate dehydrogenase major subunit